MAKLLQITGLFFLCPLSLAWYFNTDFVFRYGLWAVVILAWLNHGSYNPMVQQLDTYVVHGMTAYHIVKGVMWPAQTCNVFLMYAAAAYGALVHWGLRANRSDSNASILWHASVHFFMALGSSALMPELGSKK